MNIVNQLDKDARSIISFAYMTNHYTVNVIASILSMSERNVQRILSDSLRMIAYLDPDINFTINDLKDYYYTRNKKNNLVIKKDGVCLNEKSLCNCQRAINWRRNII